MEHVYELRDSNGKVLYVGKSKRPIIRNYEHNGVNGKFTKQNLDLHIIKSFDNKREALDFEGELKLLHGFIWTEKELTAKATNHLKRKLTSNEVKEIRAKHIPRKYSMRRLAKEYNVHNGTICKIINNKRY